jgi:hypothetical protein
MALHLVSGQRPVINLHGHIVHDLHAVHSRIFLLAKHCTKFSYPRSNKPQE